MAKNSRKRYSGVERFKQNKFTKQLAKNKNTALTYKPSYKKIFINIKTGQIISEKTYRQTKNKNLYKRITRDYGPQVIKKGPETARMIVVAEKTKKQVNTTGTGIEQELTTPENNQTSALDKIYRSEIAEINKVRKTLGLKALPYRDVTGYKKLKQYCMTRYEDAEFAAKVIATDPSMNSYQINKIKNSKNPKATLDKIVERQFYNKDTGRRIETSIDTVIREENISMYGSQVISQMAARGASTAQIKKFKSNQSSVQDLLAKGLITGF